jgi:thioredoxin reductase (NADPH)
MEKVIIIGSGPAGYTAAIYSSRALLKPLMIEGEVAGGQLMITSDVENYPGFAEAITGPGLMDVMRKQAERFGTRFITENVTKVDLKSRPFKVWIGDKKFESETLIISTGATAQYLGLPGEQSYYGRGLSACATCDGAFFKNVDVAVVGGGDTAMEEANFLTRFAKTVYIVHRKDTFRASRIMENRARANPKIKFITNMEVVKIHGEKAVDKITLKSTKDGSTSDLVVEGLFIAIGHKPTTGFLDGQLELHDSGYIKTKPGTSYTSVDGVFAAGDVQDHVYRQAVTAAGSGCMASIDCERWLEAHGE